MEPIPNNIWLCLRLCSDPNRRNDRLASVCGDRSLITERRCVRVCVCVCTRCTDVSVTPFPVMWVIADTEDVSIGISERVSGSLPPILLPFCCWQIKAPLSAQGLRPAAIIWSLSCWGPETPSPQSQQHWQCSQSLARLAVLRKWPS